MILILSRRGLMVVFTGISGFLIGVWFITLLLEHLFVVFLFLGGALNFFSAPSSLGILGHPCLACPWCSFACSLSVLRVLLCALSRLSPYSGLSIFSRRAPWPREPLGPGLLVWDRVVSSPYLSNLRLKNCLSFSRYLQNSTGLIFLP